MINAPTQQALLAIMVHAAMADGEKSQAERDFVRDLSLQLDEQGGARQLAQAVQAALLGRLSAQQAAAQLQEPMHRQLAYEWATAVCHADGLCSPAETAFLQRLKTDLQLGGAEPETTAHTHALAQAAYAEEAAAPLHAVRAATALSGVALAGAVGATSAGPLAHTTPAVPATPASPASPASAGPSAKFCASPKSVATCLTRSRPTSSDKVTAGMFRLSASAWVRFKP